MKIGRILAALVIFAVVGCSGGDGGPKPAVLEVSFAPNTVVRAVDGNWHYDIVVEEKRGTGVVVSGFAVTRYAPSGDFISEDTYNPATFAAWFNKCGGVDNYIAGDSRRCANIVSTGTSGFRDWTIYGTDDLGNTVSATGRVALQ